MKRISCCFFYVIKSYRQSVMFFVVFENNDRVLNDKIVILNVQLHLFDLVMSDEEKTLNDEEMCSYNYCYDLIVHQTSTYLDRL